MEERVRQSRPSAAPSGEGFSLTGAAGGRMMGRPPGGARVARQGEELPPPLARKQLRADRVRMEQLVGYACVVCGQRIDSIVEGRFCEVCGSPVHTGCVKPDGPAPGACAGCGGGRNGPAAQQVQSERSRRRRTAAATYPVSRVCPACGDSGFKRVAPERWVAYGSDRVCRACGTRY